MMRVENQHSKQVLKSSTCPPLATLTNDTIKRRTKTEPRIKLEKVPLENKQMQK